MTQGVVSGSVGASYGPYSVRAIFPRLLALLLFLIDLDAQYNARGSGLYNASRFSAAPSETSMMTSSNGGEKALPASSATVPLYMWDQTDPDLDDPLHNSDPKRDASSFTIFSARGWANVGFLVILLAGLITLFAGYPIIAATTGKGQGTLGGSNIGGTNSSGQVPSFPGMPTLIDDDTDESVYTRTGSDGKKYNLVFSDEFNTDGRTFWEGDDPFWEAMDFNYW